MNSSDPSNLPRGPRRFVAYWLRDLSDGFNHRGFVSLIPFEFLVSAAIVFFVARYAVPELWLNLENIIALYAAVLAVNAILLAICWAAFSRILDTLSEGEFGAWVRLHKQDRNYAFYIDYIHMIQVVAVCSAAAGLGTSILPLPDLVQRVMLGITVASSAFAGRWSAGCVRLMQDLTDLRAKFRDQKGTQITPIPLGKPK